LHHLSHDIKAAVAATLALTSIVVNTSAAQAARPVDGIWQTDGYNSIIASATRGAALRHTKSSCAASVRNGRHSRAFDGDGFRFTVRPTGGRLTMQIEGSVGVSTCAGSRRPARCLASGPGDPLRSSTSSGRPSRELPVLRQPRG